MPFLDEILDRTNEEISAAKKERSIGDLKRMIRDAPPLRSFASALASGFGIIAEVKRKSPSAGLMLEDNYNRAPVAYSKNPNVKAVSVLTNFSHFGMRVDQLSRIKPLVGKPILRKDFIIKEYQIYEARAFGADAVLLMANVLNKKNDLKKLFDLSCELEMDVLFEVHTRKEIDLIPDGAKIYGVNSRRFMATKRWRFAKMFLLLERLGLVPSNQAPDPSVELNTFSLIKHLPKNAIKVAESGVKPNRISDVIDLGYDAVLVGTSLLKSPDGIESVLADFDHALAAPSRRRSNSSIPVPA